MTAKITTIREGEGRRTDKIKLTTVMQYLNSIGVETVPDFESDRLYVVSITTPDGVITV